MSKQTHIGLFFGSFNPIHVGHLMIADYMAQAHDFDSVWLVITPQNPDKDPKELLDESHRYEMVRLATFANTRLIASKVEFDLAKPTYTVNTLNHLSELHPDHKFSMIGGTDTAQKLSDWHRKDEILDNYQFYLYPRNYIPQAFVPFPNEANLLDFYQKYDINHLGDEKAPMMDISSTVIRARIVAGMDLTYLVHDDVAKYIKQHDLYQKEVVAL